MVVFTVNYSGDYGNLYELKAEGSNGSPNPADNTSLVVIDLYLRRINSSLNGAYNATGTAWSITIDGTTQVGNSTWDTRNTTEWQKIGSASKLVTHNSDGSKTITVSATHTGNSASGSSKMGNASGSGSYKLINIPRYATVSQSLNSKTINSITMKWSSDSTIDYIWYSINNGSSWTGIDVTDGTSGTYAINGLSPNTTYNIKTRVRRKDSQLTTDSSALSVATYDIAKISSASNFNLGSNASVTITNPANATASLQMKVNTTEILSKNLSTGTNTITFTDTQLDNIYKKFTNSNFITVSYVLTTNNNPNWINSKNVTCTLTGNQKTAKIGKNGAKRAKVFIGKNGVKRAIVWVGDKNNIPRRCI